MVVPVQAIPQHRSMHPQANPGTPASSPEHKRAIAAPKPFHRNRPISSSPFARRRPPSDPDESAPKKRRTGENDPPDPPPQSSQQKLIVNRHADVIRDDTVNTEPLEDEMRNADYAANMISFRVQDMLSRLQASLYSPGNPESPTVEQNERMDIILDLLISINQAGNNIPKLKRVILQMMKSLDHDRPFQHALFQVYNACMCLQNQTLRLGPPSPKNC